MLETYIWWHHHSSSQSHTICWIIHEMSARTINTLAHIRQPCTGSVYKVNNDTHPPEKGYVRMALLTAPLQMIIIIIIIIAAAAHTHHSFWLLDAFIRAFPKCGSVIKILICWKFGTNRRNRFSNNNLKKKTRENSEKI